MGEDELCEITVLLEISETLLKIPSKLCYSDMVTLVHIIIL